MTKIRNILDKFFNFTNKVEERVAPFFYGYSFPIIIAIIGFMCYALDISHFGLIVFGVISFFIFLFFSDVTPFLPIMTMFLFVLNGQKDYSDNITPLIVVFSIAFIGFCSRFFRRDFKFKGGKLYLPILFVCLSISIAGINTKYVYYYTRGLVGIITIGPLTLLIYFLFRNNLKYSKYANLKTYYPFTMMVAGILVSLEMLITKADVIHFDFIKKQFSCCNVNGAALFIMVAFFFTFYLAIYTKKYYRYFLVMIFELLGILLSKCDGVLLISSAVTFLSFIPLFFILKKKDYINCIVSFAVLFLILSFTFLLTFYLGYFREFFDKLPEKLTNPSGRLVIYDSVFDLFIHNPILGVGFGYNNNSITSYTTNDWSMFYFHSTIYQVLASLGILGVFVYIFYFYRRYLILSHKQNTFTFFAIIAFSAAELYGLIDNVEFISTPVLLTTTVLVAVVEVINYSSEFDKKLPLVKNI